MEESAKLAATVPPGIDSEASAFQSSKGGVKHYDPWTRLRALVDDRGQNVESAGPAVPDETLGLDGVPEAGDPMGVGDNERRAREITE